MTSYLNKKAAPLKRGFYRLSGVFFVPRSTSGADRLRHRIGEMLPRFPFRSKMEWLGVPFKYDAGFAASLLVRLNVGGNYSKEEPDRAFYGKLKHRVRLIKE